ncbi:ribosome-associated heat shock protein Hsp15 [Pseudaeromonas sharmana]|uniref:Heat shock protein 15 n=1 Tax=Pseudaeromonas sharmana TaxID=328412 RepID=A0ABV8CL74_9GAMM
MNKETAPIAVRLDKWLWAARFYKTRALARSMIEGGKVHYNGQRSKPSKLVEVGALLRLWQGNDEKEIQVMALSEQRRSASEATFLYLESEASRERREKLAEARRLNSLYAPHPDTKPDKKQRRDLQRWKESHSG